MYNCWLVSFPRQNAVSGPVISGLRCIFSFFLAAVVVRLQHAAALWYSDVFLRGRTARRVHMHLKGHRRDHLLMFHPFTPVSLCPRGNFNPLQMQTASPWKLLWKLPRQQNTRQPRLFNFWTFFVLIFAVFEERRPPSVLLRVCGESIYLWFCRSER